MGSRTLSELADPEALGHDYGCPSCQADGAADIVAVAVDGERLATTFDLLESTPGLGALKVRTVDLFAAAERCAIGSTFGAIDWTGPFTATIGQP